ncbi:MAG: outer membrane protein assembly factor BamA [candidate division WOR-3 bacterium]|nr:outer membrane protein assembly factor BamA [candidate division WOR-3 bacterium]
MQLNFRLSEGFNKTTKVCRIQTENQKIKTKQSSVVLVIATLFSLIFCISEIIARETSPIIIGLSAQTKFTDSTLVIKTSGLKIGNRFDKQELATAIQQIYQLKLYETIEVDTTRIADGVIVRFVVQEYPIIKDYKFFGNNKIKTKDLKEKTNIKIGEVLTNQKLFDWQTKIRDLYKEKGFILTNIKVERSLPDSNNRIIVNFQIEEGTRVRIKHIEIEGNNAIADRTIKRKLVNKEKKWYRKGLFKEEEFKNDLERIVNFYKEKGFLDAKVEDYALIPEENQEWLNIKIKVSEGKRYYVGDIIFEGDSAISERELIAGLRIRPGQVYNSTKINQTLTELYSIYSEEGYIYCQIAPIEQIQDDTVNIKYAITEGNPARIRLVIIEGNERTQDKVIRRQISTLPGTLFKRSEVIRSQRDIFNLGFFEDVKLDYRRTEEDNEIDLIYQVKEKSSFGTIGAGVSYSATDKLTGYLELTQPNLFGKGQRLAIKFEKGGKKTNAEIGFNEPYLFDKPVSAGFNLSYLTRTYDYYEKQEKSIGFNFSRPLMLDYSRIYWGVGLSDAYVPPKSIQQGYAPTSYNNVYRDTIHRTTFTPSVQFIRDSRDYIYNPLSGSILAYSLELSTIDIYFHRHIFDASFYFPMLKKFSLMFRTRFAVIEGFSRNDTIPIYERFYPGGTGADGIRGYPDRSLGVSEGGYNIGGKALAIYSLEYKFRPSPQLAFLTFFDAGNTWNSFKDFNISNLKRGVGVGVRLEIPMLGLIGFDFGYGFDRDGKGRWEPHFQIGRTF